MTDAGAVREVAVGMGASFARWQRELAESLVQEADVARELREAPIQQRDAVARMDNAGVEASVDAIGRILLTVEAAKARRTGLVTAVTGIPDLPLDQLETSLGVELGAPLQHARQRLRRAAQDVAQEVAINRAVLRRAVEAGEAYVQALFSCVVGPSPAYAPAERAESAAATGVLVNRRA